jgi:hypothetical protein
MHKNIRLFFLFGDSPKWKQTISNGNKISDDVSATPTQKHFRHTPSAVQWRNDEYSRHNINSSNGTMCGCHSNAVLKVASKWIPWQRVFCLERYGGLSHTMLFALQGSAIKRPVAAEGAGRSRVTLHVWQQKATCQADRASYLFIYLRRVMSSGSEVGIARSV